jgi:hypothetical protein
MEVSCQRRKLRCACLHRRRGGQETRKEGGKRRERGVCFDVRDARQSITL